MLGDYQILRHIGQGSLGDVLLAEHRFLKKQFVLKVLPEELSQDRTFLDRFQEEVTYLSTLEHPYLVKIHNVSFAEGKYFLVVDCVIDSLAEMTNLAQYMAGRKERLKEEEMLRVLRQIAEAIDYIHEKNMYHGCLKLNNLLIGKGKLGFDISISDTGLSRIIGSNALLLRSYKAMAYSLGLAAFDNQKMEERYYPFPIEAYKISRLNQSFVQNFAFFAPEQKYGRIDAKADIYAFGVLTYYLIAGKFPEGRFEMPSEIAPEYSRNWDNFIHSCLQLHPEKRPLGLCALIDGLKTENKEHLKSPVLNQILETKIQNQQLKSEIQEEVLAVLPLATAAQASAPSAQIATPFNPPVKKNNPAEPSFVPSSVFSKEPATVSLYQPEEINKSAIEPHLTQMVEIRGGYFFRGCNERSRDESPRHQIYVHSFAIDIHPVTNEQFVRFLEFVGGEKDANYHDLIRLKDSRIKRAAGKLFIESGYSRHPVVGVTWYGAVAYANWVKKRIPTEAEWEIAALGGNENATYPTGMTIEKVQANFFSSDTTAVMSYPPNDYGLYDMAGNVYEWCQDWYGYNYYETSAQEPNNPKGPSQGVYRVLKGGCWKSLKEDLRCAHRHRNNPGTVNGTYGFRCALDIN